MADGTASLRSPRPGHLGDRDRRPRRSRRHCPRPGHPRPRERGRRSRHPEPRQRPRPADPDLPDAAVHGPLVRPAHVRPQRTDARACRSARPGIEVQGPLAAILGGIGLAAINTIVAAFLALDEEESFYRNVVKRLARRSAGAIVSNTPGVVIIQIDGLSAGVLRQAIRTGLVPNIARWVRTGSHRLVGWESGLPSGTSASQAGILHGRRRRHPGLPLVREGERSAPRLEPARRRGRDRTPAVGRRRAPGRRRLVGRQPVLG